MIHHNRGYSIILLAVKTRPPPINSPTAQHPTSTIYAPDYTWKVGVIHMRAPKPPQPARTRRAAWAREARKGHYVRYCKGIAGDALNYQQLIHQAKVAPKAPRALANSPSRTRRTG